MKLSTLLFTAIISLDVAVFPFSCSSSKSNYGIFDAHIVDEENEVYSNIFYTVKMHSSKISEPYIESDLDDYYISYWYLLGDETQTPVVFPYTFNDDDKVPYYCGYRSSVVFIAKWVQNEQ